MKGILGKVQWVLIILALVALCSLGVNTIGATVTAGTMFGTTLLFSLLLFWSGHKSAPVKLTVFRVKYEDTASIGIAWLFCLSILSCAIWGYWTKFDFVGAWHNATWSLVVAFIVTSAMALLFYGGLPAVIRQAAQDKYSLPLVLLDAVAVGFSLGSLPLLVFIYVGRQQGFVSEYIDYSLLVDGTGFAVAGFNMLRSWDSFHRHRYGLVGSSSPLRLFDLLFIHANDAAERGEKLGIGLLKLAYGGGCAYVLIEYLRYWHIDGTWQTVTSICWAGVTLTCIGYAAKGAFQAWMAVRLAPRAFTQADKIKGDAKLKDLDETLAALDRQRTASDSKRAAI